MSEKTHTSYHNSGLTNHDYSGNSGTQHEHEKPDGSIQKTWNHPDAGKVTQDGDGVWRKSDGTPLKGGY